MSYCLSIMPSSRLKWRPEDPSHLSYRYNGLGDTLYGPSRQLNHMVLSKTKNTLCLSISLKADILNLHNRFYLLVWSSCAFKMKK